VPPASRERAGAWPRLRQSPWTGPQRHPEHRCHAPRDRSRRRKTPFLPYFTQSQDEGEVGDRKVPTPQAQQQRGAVFAAAAGWPDPAPAMWGRAGSGRERGGPGIAPTRRRAAGWGSALGASHQHHCYAYTASPQIHVHPPVHVCMYNIYV